MENLANRTDTLKLTSDDNISLICHEINNEGMKVYINGVLRPEFQREFDADDMVKTIPTMFHQ